ncbi:MAG: hypothetical protein JW699_04110 [Chitinispirillaceae bacterium]|nr:hypothetical protein [Chitinispirillaceae bacterium]
MSDRAKKRAVIAVLQEPLRITPRPFAPHARRLGVTEEKVIAALRKNLRRGVIRRFAGIIKHDRAGYRCNAMIAFEVEGDRCDRAGRALAAFPFVTHCYRRTAYPDWPYTLYAMMHARTRQEFEQRLEQMKNAVPHQSMIVLPTVKEYRKSSYRLPGR